MHPDPKAATDEPTISLVDLWPNLALRLQHTLPNNGLLRCKRDGVNRQTKNPTLLFST